jgi:hypothetical protein
MDSAGYVNWFHSYLSKILSHVHYSGALSVPFEVLSGVPQGSVLGLLLCNGFISHLYNVITFSICLIFVDDKNFSDHKVSSWLFFTSDGH